MIPGYSSAALNINLYRRCTKLVPLPFCILSRVQRRRFNSSVPTLFPREDAVNTRNSHEPFEEENLPGYSPDQFYSVRIGDTIKSRYRIVGKLGYGANSTVWLCRDVANEYVVLKIYVRTPPGRFNRDSAFYSHLETLDTTHSGLANIRLAIDRFDLVQRCGSTYHCLDHRPLQTTLFAFQRPLGKPLPLPEEMVKPIIRNTLKALDFLHVEADVTHCDLKLSNTMLSIEDEEVLSDYEKHEQTCHRKQKAIAPDRTLYAPRPFRAPQSHAYGLPLLCDSGEARIKAKSSCADIQPDIYKAPEVLMETSWNHSADIWNFACLLWEMIEAECLFSGNDEEGFHNHRCHIHEIVCLLGEPPLTFLKRSPHSWRLFDDQGVWKAEPAIDAKPLMARGKSLQGQSGNDFLDFIDCMLRWLPEDRWTARQLLSHSWLRGSE